MRVPIAAACIVVLGASAFPAAAQQPPPQQQPQPSPWDPEPEPPAPPPPAQAPPQAPPPGYPPPPPGYPPQAYPGQPYPAQPYPAQPYPPPPYPPQPYPAQPYPPPGSSTYELDQATRTGTRSRREVWLSSLGTFALAYGIPVLVAATTSSTTDDVFFAPIVGPWMFLGEEADELDGEAIAWIAIDGVVQLVGAIGFVVGLASPERVGPSPVRSRGPSLRPVVGLRSFGLSVVL